MPILWAETAEVASGVIGQAMARAAEAETQLGQLIQATGGLILGGIAYFFGNQPFSWAPPAYPSCTAVPSSWLGGYTGGDDFSDSPDDVFDMNWVEAFDNQQTGGGNYNY